MATSSSSCLCVEALTKAREKVQAMTQISLEGALEVCEEIVTSSRQWSNCAEHPAASSAQIWESQLQMCQKLLALLEAATTVYRLSDEASQQSQLRTLDSMRDPLPGPVQETTQAVVCFHSTMSLGLGSAAADGTTGLPSSRRWAAGCETIDLVKQHEEEQGCRICSYLSPVMMSQPVGLIEYNKETASPGPTKQMQGRSAKSKGFTVARSCQGTRQYFVFGILVSPSRFSEVAFDLSIRDVHKCATCCAIKRVVNRRSPTLPPDHHPFLIVLLGLAFAMLSGRVASLFRHVAPRSAVAQSEIPVAAIPGGRRSTRWLSSTRRTNSSLKDTFESACSTREIPGVVLLATNQTGSWNYIKAFGRRSTHESVSDEPLDEDCPMWIASCTKLLTSTASMQCVERGWVGLDDDDVRGCLHELRDIDIINPTATGRGLLTTKNVRPITLRHASPVHSGSRDEPDLEDCLSSGGIYATPPEYVKVLRALLCDASAGPAFDATLAPSSQLLRRSTAEAMFEPQLNEAGRKALLAVSEIPKLNLMLGGMPVATKKDWGLGGMLVMDDLPGWRQKGTMTWGGTPNLTWWIDPKAELCGLYAGQLMPVGDKISVEMTELFEREMYARAKQAFSILGLIREICTLI
ncbi:hypothetical protein O1611_g7775 [Lasiodiplodia mahajangana]|uniref:Uncharacterized protein n=1 Tax=Lasiodiplodia mahajangana TaxID=1108764 RepID=A0ACC2JEX7_9PEZI|nr:hypothetical protein O1611_g7775 [Lasiodiplodia mahajangana]